MCSTGKPWAHHPADCRKFRLGQAGGLQHLSPRIAPVSPNISLHYSQTATASPSIAPASPCIAPASPHIAPASPLHHSSILPHCSSILLHSSGISPHCRGLQAMLLPSGIMQGLAACPGWWDRGLWGRSPARKKDLMCSHPSPHMVPVSQKELLSRATVLAMLNLPLNKVRSSLNKRTANKHCRVS